MKKPRYQIASHLWLRLAESGTPRATFWQKPLAGAKVSAAITQGTLTG
jgi:hypothetical protein